jgi:hypothetical protein
VSKPSQMLQDFGTKLNSLTPGSIVGAAKSDLRLRAKKAEDADPALQREQYAFHRKHVNKASDAGHLMTLALDERDLGLESAKFNTRLIYTNVPLLRAAREEFENGRERGGSGEAGAGLVSDAEGASVVAPRQDRLPVEGD